MRRSGLIMIAWWFLYTGHHGLHTATAPAVVGPFHEIARCEEARATVEKGLNVEINTYTRPCHNASPAMGEWPKK